MKKIEPRSTATIFMKIGWNRGGGTGSTGNSSTTDKYADATVVPRLFVATQLYHPSSS